MQSPGVARRIAQVGLDWLKMGRALMIKVRHLSMNDRYEVLRINAAARPAVAALDEIEAARVLGLPNHHLVATNSAGTVLAYILAFDANSSYDGEEFQEFLLKTPAPFVYIDQVAVHAAWRGMGIGKAFYGALESIAELRDCHLLCADVNTDPPNPGSMAFHKRIGFASIGSLATRDGRRVELLTKAVYR